MEGMANGHSLRYESMVCMFNVKRTIRMLCHGSAARISKTGTYGKVIRRIQNAPLICDDLFNYYQLPTIVVLMKGLLSGQSSNSSLCCKISTWLPTRPIYNVHTLQVSEHFK